MSVKASILEKLENRRGEYLSGEQLARGAGVSRQAVGKAVNALKAEGYPIDAVPNRGYRLPAECDVLSAKAIAERTGARVVLYDCVPSTNGEAAKLYLDGGDCIVVSRAQSGGRKKDGGTFPSPRDRGIYCSIALTLRLPLQELTRLREQCGQIVAAVISRASGQNAVCKHVDEVFIGDVKVCGILIECGVNAAAARTDYAVIGVGIYTYLDPSPLPIFPDDTRNHMICEIYAKIKEATLNL